MSNLVVARLRGLTQDKDTSNRLLPLDSMLGVVHHWDIEPQKYSDDVIYLTCVLEFEGPDDWYDNTSASIVFLVDTSPDLVDVLFDAFVEHLVGLVDDALWAFDRDGNG